MPPEIDRLTGLWSVKTGRDRRLLFDLGVQGVDFLLDVDGQLQGRDDAAVGPNIVQVQTPLDPLSAV